MDTGAMPVLMFATDAEASADAVVRARRGAASGRARTVPLTHSNSRHAPQAPLLTPDASMHSPATVAGETKRVARQRGHKGGRMKVRGTGRYHDVRMADRERGANCRFDSPVATFRTQAANLTVEQVRRVQHLSLREAADECEIGTTQVRIQDTFWVAHAAASPAPCSLS